MRKLLRAFINSIGDDFGFPSTLKDTLAQMRACPAPIARDHSVAFYDVVGWHEWGASICNTHGEGPGMVRGWRRSRRGYESVSLPLLTDFGLSSKVDAWTCDIQDVHGLGASKSELSNFSSLDDLVETNSREMIVSIDRERLDKNLAHDEIRILRGASSPDFFARCQWDGRVYLLNSGGSHHFSAAKYIAKRIGVGVPLTGRLYEHKLNPVVVQDLLKHFEVFAVPAEGWPDDHSLHDLLRASDATYYWKVLPRPWDSFRAIFLPKDEPRALRAAGVLRDRDVTDLAIFLSRLLRRQQSLQSTAR